jgi:hypothetical protein
MVVPRFIVRGVPTGVSNFSLSSLLLLDNPLLLFVALVDDVANRFGTLGATTFSFESSKRKDDSSSVADEYSEDDDEEEEEEEKEPSELSETPSSSSVESDCCLRFLRPPLFLVLFLLLWVSFFLSSPASSSVSDFFSYSIQYLKNADRENSPTAATTVIALAIRLVVGYEYRGIF